MCGVGDHLVAEVRRSKCVNPAVETRIGKDGKERKMPVRLPQGEPPSDRKMLEHIEGKETKQEARKVGPPCIGMQFARLAVMRLEEIDDNDTERKPAFDYVKGWIKDNEI
jgi:hypothetical protein